MKVLKTTAYAVGLITLLVAVWYGAWNLERWFNWSLGYESDVKEYLVPLEKRIDSLEQRIRVMENNNIKLPSPGSVPPKGLSN